MKSVSRIRKESPEMTLSEAQAKANKKYLSAHYARINYAAPKEEIEAIKEAAKAAGLSTNGFIREACLEKIQRQQAGK